MRPLELHPDRLLPAGEEQRRVARQLLSAVDPLPLVSPHGHLDANLFLHNEPFADPAELLVTSDHYVVRLLHSQGVSLEALGVGRKDGTSATIAGRQVWGQLCEHWDALAGTPSRLWLEHELHELFGLREVPSPANADATYQAARDRLATEELLPRSLYRRFGLEVLTTTDSPLCDLRAHEELASDPTWHGRILPTYRPDELVDPCHPGFSANVARLAEITDIETDGYDGYLEALRARREAFARAGATATDHGIPVTTTERLDPAELARVFRRLTHGGGSSAEVEAFRGHMLDEMARMACDDGLVMQLHVGVVRDYVVDTAAAYGSDIGQDFPTRTDYTRTLRPLLSRYGDHPGFKLVVYTVDETTFAREIGPLVSYFPALFAGAPWWFLDAPDSMARAFSALGETAGLAKLAGFVDDTRSLCGIGARHDLARRVLCGYLSRLVCEHRLGIDEATEHATGFAYHRPKALFKV